MSLINCFLFFDDVGGESFFLHLSSPLNVRGGGGVGGAVNPEMSPSKWYFAVWLVIV